MQKQPTLISMQHFRIQGARGELDAVYFPGSSSSRANSHRVLFAPPFAMDLNNARQFTASVSRHLAALGNSVLLFDLFGCGDSDGNHLDADWKTWCDDLVAAARWLECDSAPIVVCGLGLGGLIAAHAAVGIQAAPFTRLVLVNPVVEGRQLLRRLRIAGSLDPASAKSIAGFTHNKMAFEIWGYQISHQLVSELEHVSLLALGPHLTQALEWIEAGGVGNQHISAAVTPAWDEWDRLGVRYERRLVSLPAPWEVLTRTQSAALDVVLTQALSVV